MYANLAIDFGIGLIPILGDLADILFKANSRNYKLLYIYLEKKGREHPVQHSVQPKQSWARRWFGCGPEAASASTEEPSNVIGSMSASGQYSTGAPPVPAPTTASSHVGAGSMTHAEPSYAKVGGRKDKPLPAINS